MVKITEEKKQKILRDPVLDNNKSIQRVHWLFSKIEQAEEFASQIDYPSLLSEEELKVVENPQPNNDLGKAALAVRNNGIDLANLINYEKNKHEKLLNKSHELKQKIMDSLSEWTVLGGVEGALSNGKVSDIRLGSLSEEDYQEVKKVIVKRIKQNPHEWNIKEIDVSTGKGAYGYKQKDILLIHKTFKVKYDEYGQLSVVYGKVHWKSGFFSEQWTEIEQALAQSQQQAQEKQPFKFPFFSNFGSDSKH